MLVKKTQFSVVSIQRNSVGTNKNVTSKHISKKVKNMLRPFSSAAVCRIKIFLISLLIIFYVVIFVMILKIPIDSPELVEVEFAERHKYRGVNRNNDDGSKSILEKQRYKIQQMMVHAWSNYKLYAWGKNELNAIERTHNNNSIFGKCEIGATIVDALDTLYLMNLMEEFEEGRSWVANEFSLDECDDYISVFEVNIRFIGGFLSLYALTGDLLFKEKAKYVADKMNIAFMSPSKIPYAKINFHTNNCEKGMTVIADCGTLSLELTYLSEITNDLSYVERVKEINVALRDLHLEDGLYPYWIDPSMGVFISEQVLFGANSDSFYEYLLKAWIQSGSKDQELRNWFIQTIDAVLKHLVKKTKDGFWYITGKYGNFSDHKMDHLACFAGGFFALAADSSIHPNSSKLLKLGKEITRTCRETYVTTKTGLGPEIMSFHPRLQEIRTFTPVDRSFKLRPETVESYFYLWRITHDQKYRDWAWDVVEAIEKYCRVPSGYTGITDVYLENAGVDGIQQSFFLSETLKYLYLIFSADSVMPLDKWVFNTEAHPLPIMTGK